MRDVDQNEAVVHVLCTDGEHTAFVGTAHLQLNFVALFQVGCVDFEQHRGFGGIDISIACQACTVGQQSAAGQAGVQNDGAVQGWVCFCVVGVGVGSEAQVGLEAHGADRYSLASLRQGDTRQGESAAQGAGGCDGGDVGPCAACHLHLQFVTRAQHAHVGASDGLAGDIGDQIGHCRVVADRGDFTQSQGVNGGVIAQRCVRGTAGGRQAQGGNSLRVHRTGDIFERCVRHDVAVCKKQLVIQHTGAARD